jgi:hypothetical protein
MTYSKQMGRLQVIVSRDGVRDHAYGHGAEVICQAGWNDSCPMVVHTMSVEELRDLRYMLDRAIGYAEMKS